MAIFNFPQHWSPSYIQQFERNIGIVSLAQQDKIKNAKIAILGTGGLGAPVALQLAYSGCENLVLVDYDKIEKSNLNRQPFKLEDIGRFKVDVLARELIKINPHINIKKSHKIDEKNIYSILDGIDVISLSLDGPYGSILVSRKARELGIPILESWAIPYLFSWWFTKESLS
ncbi:MAG: hypothetical protein GF364_01185, partial [Candidatus Lokiarchaeota archaeon]|nr:hypothetical protein [Candidatus Lokiarchaeota archaeon]